jgi:hypothetical protein
MPKLKHTKLRKRSRELRKERQRNIREREGKRRMRRKLLKETINSS